MSQPAHERVRAVDDARTELSDALRAAGITLPSLRLDVLSYDDVAPLVLVNLGHCTAATAHALAVALRTDDHVEEAERSTGRTHTTPQEPCGRQPSGNGLHERLEKLNENIAAHFQELGKK